MTATNSGKSSKQRVRELNDRFRKGFDVRGERVMTAGVAALSFAERAAIMAKIEDFSAFTPENDPYGEHDFGTVHHAGRELFWKIDYYDADMMYGSENPADSSKTVRVMTVMLADEY